ncbi:hypothetical protein ACI68E_002617 [Malassezia pachydermatis]
MGPTPMRVSPKVARTTTHDADLARKRLREKCLLTIQKERADKRSTTLAHMRQSAWLSHVMQEEAREGVLSEEEIGCIIREEYERALRDYEQQGREELGDVDIDAMLRVEDDIVKESKMHFDYEQDCVHMEIN